MQACFLLTSAINTKFGVFDTDERLRQTLGTISSIQASAPGAAIHIIECSAIALSPVQRDVLQRHCNSLIDYANSDFVQALFRSDNWDIVKNLTEVACFRDALWILHQSGSLQPATRLFKLSGRYVLNRHFNLETHLQSDRIIFSRRRVSQFGANITGIGHQYMSRLWSWPCSLVEPIAQAYTHGFDHMVRRMEAGGYCDIEHMLFDQLCRLDPIEVDPIGVEGRLGPNGVFVSD